MATDPQTNNASVLKNHSAGLTNPAFYPSLDNPDSDNKGQSQETCAIPSRNSDEEVGHLKKVKPARNFEGIRKYRGFALAFTASFCFSLVVLFVKVLQEDYGLKAYGASFWRYSGIALPTIPLFIYFEVGSRRKKGDSLFHSLLPLKENWLTWIILVVLGFSASSAALFRYYALQYLTIGDTLVITYSTPVLVTIFAHCFLEEKWGIFPILIAIVTLFGVVIVAKPPLITGASAFEAGSLMGIQFACGSLLCTTVVVIATRKVREVHFTIMMLIIGTIGIGQALVLSCFMGHFGLPTTTYDKLFVSGVSGFSFIAQVAWVLALKFEDAGPVSLIRCCDVIFGFLLQFVFLQVIPDIYSAVGATIVISGVLSIGFRKWLTSLPEEDGRKRKWGLILK